MSSSITALEKLLASGKDSALLRFSLGSEYLKARDYAMAAGHLQRAGVLVGAHQVAGAELLERRDQLGFEALPLLLRFREATLEAAFGPVQVVSPVACDGLVKRKPAP